MLPTLPSIPKPTKASFRYALNGCDKLIKAELIRCQNCHLTVHDVCYGANVQNTGRYWLCDRCEAKAFNSVNENPII